MLLFVSNFHPDLFQAPAEADKIQNADGNRVYFANISGNVNFGPIGIASGTHILLENNLSALQLP